LDYFLVLFKEYRHSIVAVATIIISLLLLLSVRPGTRSPGFVEDVALDVVGGIQNVIQSPVEAYQNFSRRIVQLQEMDLENQRFRQELKKLRPLGTQVIELEMENQRLRQLLEMSIEPKLRSLGARVVGDTSTAFANVLLINIGRSHGSRINASVLVPEGVVGRVVQAGTSTSLVLTLLDLNSRVPALVQRSRVKGIIAGFNGQSLTMEYVSKDADIRVGDQILTSGIAGSFPKGLVIGTIKEVQEGDIGLFRRLLVQPSVDFDRVEEVRLLIPGQGYQPSDRSKQLRTIKAP